MTLEVDFKHFKLLNSYGENSEFPYVQFFREKSLFKNTLHSFIFFFFLLFFFFFFFFFFFIC